MSVQGPPQDPWFTIDDRREAAQAMVAHARRLWQQQGIDRRDVAEAALTIYFGNPRHTVNGGSVREYVDRAFGIQHDPQAENVVQMIVDTMVSHTIKDRVRPWFQTDNGDSQQQEDAKGMMHAVEGIFFQNGVYEDEDVYQHGYLFDGGLTRVIPDFARKRVTLRRVPCWQWLVPDEEGKDPRQAFYPTTVDRAMLLADYGFDEEGNKTELYELIRMANPAPKDMLPRDNGEDSVSDRVLVTEGFHLPSAWVDDEDPAAFGLNEDNEQDESVDPGHDGRRMLVLDDDIVLCDEPYPYEEFPVSEFFPARNPTDYWSRGVPETLAGAQLMVNKATRRISNIMHLNAVSRLLVDRRAKLNLAKFTNDLVSILECTGSPQQVAMYLTGTAPPAELFQERDRYIASMKAQYGLNEMTLYGEKPPGVDHAPGMEHLLDEVNLRHIMKFRARDKYITKLARLVVDACRLMAMRDPDFEVMFGDNKELKRIRWKDVELPRRSYIVKLWAANLLPQTPGMKMKRMAELANLGEPFKSQAVAYLAEDYPDVEALAGKVNAKRKNIESKITTIAREGMSEKTAPQPYMNLALAKSIAEDYIAEFDRNGDEDAMENVIEFWEACDKLQKQLMPTTAPPAAPPTAPQPPVVTAGVPLQ
jgi:hypothetical protein